MGHAGKVHFLLLTEETTICGGVSGNFTPIAHPFAELSYATTCQTDRRQNSFDLKLPEKGMFQTYVGFPLSFEVLQM